MLNLKYQHSQAVDGTDKRTDKDGDAESIGICSCGSGAGLTKSNGRVMVFTGAINKFSPGSVRLMAWDKTDADAIVQEQPRKHEKHSDCS